MPPFHHSKIIPELMENAGCELWYLPQYSRLFQPHRGGKKLRLQLEKSYLNTTFMFIEPPMRCFRSCKYFAAHCCSYRSWLKLILVGCLITALIIAAHSFNLQELLQTSLVWVRSLGVLGPIAYIALYNLATVLFVPGSLLSFKGGAYLA